MSGPQPNVYEFGEFRIEASKRSLLRDGAPVALTPKAFDTLLHLVQNRQRIVEKDELMQAIWPDTTVEENNLNQNISTLRRVLGESRGENRYIATIPGKGYRFIAEVEGRGPVPAAVRALPERVTLAVLPFENLSSDPEREYLADGLTEETIAALGQIDPDRLGVIGRTSVMAYRKTKKTIAEIGSDLGASYLIESTLRTEGGRFRVTSKLIRVEDQVQVWSASYDSEPASILNFQRELSAAIAEQIRLRLSPERLSALARRQTRNAEAYDLYLRGRHYWYQLTPPTTKRAVEYFSRATQLDPEYALALSGLADCYSGSPINGDAPPLGMCSLAREAAARAVAAEPNLAEAQTSLGFVRFWFDWDWRGAEGAYRKALDLDPSYPMAHRMLGIVLAHMGRYAEARPEMSRLRELDPLLAANQALSAQVAFAGRDYAAAVQFARQAIVVDPEFWIGLFQLGQVYEQLGESELALEALNKAGRFSGGNSKAVSLRGYLFAKLGRVNEAREVLNTLEAMARERYIPPYAMALVHAGLGEREKALEWLERAVAVRDVHMCFPPIDPKWDVFRSDPQFQALLKRCGFSESRAGA
jgi:DNA-binding winged helix-turn-helix (wHTH) protein/tetratricopeptide (TPR) repeat protein